MKKLILLSILFFLGCSSSQMSVIRDIFISQNIYSISKGIELKYLFYLPDDYDSSTVSYPLVLFLHGAEERGTDIEKVKIHGITKHISQGQNFPFITIAPQCSKSSRWTDPKIVLALTKLIEQTISDYRVDSERVYATGISMGGYGTFAIAIERPDLFSAIIPICGGVSLDRIHNLKEMPVWIFHGNADQVVPVENSIKAHNELILINDQVKLTIYPGVGHDSWTETYANEAVYAWLLNQRKSPQ